jgi:hypothetical protein
MRALLPLAAIAATACTVGVLAAALAACSAKHDPAPGEIFLAIDSNLKFPDDIDGIGISIKDQQGIVSEDNVFPLGPGDGAQLPATLAVIRGTTEPITIRAVGYKGTTPITVREVITTIPADRTALLHVDLSFLNEGLVTMPASSTLVSQLTVPCENNTSPVGGTCQSFTLDSATLPTYDPTQVGTSDGASASVDIDDCLTGGSSVTPDTTDCTIALPSAAANIGLMLPANSPGWCNGESCVVPLIGSAVDGTVGDGWMLMPDGKVHLPQGVCAKGYPVFTAPVTTTCPTFSLQHPAHQDYGAASDGGTQVNDATTPPVDAGGGDAGSVLRRPGATSLAADDSGHLYVLTPKGTTTTLEVFDTVDLSPTAPSTVVTLPYALHGQGPAAARYPLAAVAVGNANDGGVTNQLVTFDVRDAGATQTLYGNGASYFSSTFATAADGGTVFLYVENEIGACVVTPGVPADPNLAPFDGGSLASAVAFGPGLDGGGPFVAVAGQTRGVSAGIFPSLSLLAPPSFPAEPEQMIFLAGQVVWVDQNNGMYITTNAAGGPEGAQMPLLSSGVQFGSGSIAGFQNVLAWITTAQTLYKSAISGTSLAEPEVVSSNALSVTSVGNALYWVTTDGVINQGVFLAP